MQVYELYVFGWKRMNRALNAVTSKCSTIVFLSLLPAKTLNKGKKDGFQAEGSSRNWAG